MPALLRLESAASTLMPTHSGDRCGHCPEQRRLPAVAAAGCGFKDRVVLWGQVGVVVGNFGRDVEPLRLVLRRGGERAWWTVHQQRHLSRDVDERRGLDFGISLSEVACRLGDFEGIRSQRFELVSADRPVARLGVRVRVGVRLGLGLGLVRCPPRS